MHQIQTFSERVQIGALALGGFSISPVLMCYAFLSCSDPIPSLPAGPIVAATGLDGGRVAVLDATTGRLLRTAGPALRAQSYPAVSPDSTTLYYTGLALSGGGRGLVALEPANGRVRWNLQSLDTVFTGPLVGEVTTLSAGQFLVAAEAGAPDRLLWYVSRRGPLSGLASVDPRQKAASAFVAMHAAAIHVPILRGTGHLPSGTVLVCGTRKTAAGQPRANTLFFLSPRLEVLDSVVLPVTNFEAYDVAVTTDERAAYVKSYPELFKVDLLSRSITRQAQVPYYGSVVMLADSLVLVTDPGTVVATKLRSSVPLFGRAGKSWEH